MQRHPLSTILGRPALHLLLALVFVVAFCWPILVMTQPGRVFHFLYASWLLSLLALFAISRAAPGAPAEAPGDAADQPDQNAGAADEITRESL